MKKQLLTTLVAITFLATLEAQTLNSYELLKTYTKAEIGATFGLPTSLIFSDLDAYKVLYNTPDLSGNTSIASGLVIIPNTNGYKYPMACYHHGTVGSRDEAPSNIESSGDPLGLLIASQGFIVAVPDLLGLGDSPGIHPYVHAHTEASAGIDILFAARELLNEDQFSMPLKIGYNDQIFLAGYSQGGHSAMATHREIQNNYSEDFNIVAASHMSGPYSISGVMRNLILSDEQYFSTSYIPNTLLSYNAAYNLGYTIDEIFKESYTAAIQNFASENTSLWELEISLQTLLLINEGGSYPKRIIEDSLITAIESNPNHPFNLALQDNDVYDWAPESITHIKYCTADDQVPYTNATIAYDQMIANGADQVTIQDVSSESSHTECVSPAMTSTLQLFNGHKQLTVITSLETLTPNQNFEIYPSPVNTKRHPQFNIQWNTEFKQIGSMEIRDLFGRLILTQVISSNIQSTIQTQNLSSGIYLISIKASNQKTISKKIMINN